VDLSPSHLHTPFFMPLALDLLLIHGHMVVPTGGLMTQWLWISRTHPVEWLFTGDGMVLEMMVLPSCLLDDGQWMLVKLE